VMLALRGPYVRETIFTLFFLSVTAAATLQIMRQTVGRGRRLLWVMLILLADLGPGAMQPWNRLDLQAIADAGAWLSTHAADHRILEIDQRDHTVQVLFGPISSPLVYAPIQVLYGPHKMDATQAHNFVVTVLELAQDDLRQRGHLSDQTSTILASLNVGWVVGTGYERARLGLARQFPDTIDDPVLGRHWHLSEATPVLASGTLQITAQPRSFVEPLLWREMFEEGKPATLQVKKDVLATVQAMNLSLSSQSLGAIVMAARPDGAEWQHDYPQAPHIEITAYKVTSGTVHYSLHADGPGYLRLAHPFFPTTHLFRDGVEIPTARDVTSMLVLPIAAGTHEIDLVPRPSALRVMCFRMTVIGMILLAIGAAVFALRRPPVA